MATHISCRMYTDTLDKLDQLADKNGIKSRSAYLDALLREYKLTFSIVKRDGKEIIDTDQTPDKRKMMTFSISEEGRSKLISHAHDLKISQSQVIDIFANILIEHVEV